MAQQHDALTQLVQQHVGSHTGQGKLTVRDFCADAIDPDSQYQPSTGLIGKILRSESYKITPQLVGAIAAGLDLPREIVAAAAHFQLIGFEVEELTGGAPAVLLKQLGIRPGAPERAVAERWRAETGQ